MALSLAGVPYSGRNASFVGKTSTIPEYTRLGLLATSRGPLYSFAGKTEVSSLKGSGPFTRLGPMGLSADQMGSFSGKSPAPVGSDNNIDVPLKSLAVVWTSYAPSLIQDVTVSVPGLQLRTWVTYPPTVFSENTLIDVPLKSAAVVWTAYAPTVTQDGAADVAIFPPSATITWTAYAPTVEYTRDIDVPVGAITWTTYPPDVQSEGLLPAVLSSTDAAIIWSNPIIDGKTPFELMSIIAAAVAGNEAYDEAGNFVGYLSIDGSRVRLSKTPGGTRRNVTIN